MEREDKWEGRKEGRMRVRETKSDDALESQ